MAERDISSTKGRPGQTLRSKNRRERTGRRQHKLLGFYVVTLLLSVSGALGWPVLFSDSQQKAPGGVVRVEDGAPLSRRPVGSVVSFFLRPGEMEDLAPTWLPANGETVGVEGSPLHGKKLPDLVGWSVHGDPVLLNATARPWVQRGRRDHQTVQSTSADSDSMPTPHKSATAAPTERPGLFLIATGSHELSAPGDQRESTTDGPSSPKSLVYMVKIQ